MLVGESAGFADPILSAGLSLTHASAREAAFTMIELDRGGKRDWLLGEYYGRNKRRILQHIRFADYWYSANEHFSDLKEYTAEIARDAGLNLNAEKAFQWLGTGGFIEEDIGIGGFGTVSITALHQIAGRLSAERGHNAFGGYNGFVLNFQGAKKVELPHYEQGRVLPVPAFSRGGKILPLSGLLGWLVKGLEHSPKIIEAMSAMSHELRKVGITYDKSIHDGALECLEALVRDGWVECRLYKGDPLPGELPPENRFISTNRDELLPKERKATTIGSET
jgi:hypothetical protein